MRRRFAFALLMSALLPVAGCTNADGPRPTDRWQSPLYRDHPLTGMIWKPSESRYATSGEIYATLKKAEFVLVGEKHDNPDHHWLQAKLVAETGASGRGAAVVFEMITASQQPATDAYLQSHPRDPTGLGEAIGWAETGWPDWQMYEPVARQALYYDMLILYGGLDREAIREIARQGSSALGEARAESLMLNAPLAEGVRTEMRAEIYESHCGQMPEPMLDPMVSVQLAKDAEMADRMIVGRRIPGRDAAILIAGAGHVREDWGVPMHLRRRDAGEPILTVGLMEVSKGATEPADYAERYGGRLPFDFVWFTPRVDDADPCEVFADQLQRMRERRSRNGTGAD